MGGLQQIRRAFWFVTRPEIHGAHAVPITPGGKIVLVKLRYARGWRLPGGGRKRNEDPKETALRELKEEIGLTAHGRVSCFGELVEIHDHREDHATLFVVRDVEYQPPRWSLEIEDVTEAPIDALPADTSPRTRAWLAAARPKL
jgi:8-oxo-dGTP pyrophosphatase MutT (NUDIX family)